MRWFGTFVALSQFGKGVELRCKTRMTSSQGYLPALAAGIYIRGCPTVACLAVSV